MKDLLSSVSVMYKCKENNPSCDFSNVDVASSIETSYEGSEVEALPKDLRFE